MRLFTFKYFSVNLLTYVLTSLLACLVISTSSLASNGNYLNHKVEGNTVVIKTNLVEVTLNAYGEGAIATHYQDLKKKLPASHLPSFAIKEHALSRHFVIKEDKNQLTLTLNKLSAVINKAPFSISYYHKDKDQQNKLLIAEEQGLFRGAVNEVIEIPPIEGSSTATKINKELPIQGFRFHLDDTEKMLGGGERVLGMDRRGHSFPLYNRAHYGYTTQSQQMNFSIPAVMSSNKYIVLFDNSAKGYMDIAKKEKNILEFSAVAGRMSYIVFSADSYPKLLNNYVDVTGKQPLPPRWSLGNYASRFGYRSEAEVRATVDKFIDLDFPLDALILDLYWFGKDIQGHMGNLAWDNNAFPEPEKMIRDIKDKGVNTILITEPFILSTSGKWQDAVEHQALATDEHGKAKQFDFYFGNTGLVDVFNDKGQQWFNNIYQKLYQQGVTGWWGDLGEPEVHPSDTLHTLSDGSVVNADAIHNVYGHQWAKMVFDNQVSMSPDQRPFILMRSGFAGSQRYGMIPWTGDVSRSWGGLKPQVELSLQMSLLGMAYTHSDLGGFAGGEQFDQEMYIRWLQYGIFQPIYRPHGQDNIAPEAVFHDKQTQDILREYIKLRYKLLPYNYTLAYQNSTTGMPLMRPLFFEEKAEKISKSGLGDKADLTVFDNASSYLWGDAFLVTPVVSPNVTSVAVNLPAGVWFDYFTSDNKPAKKYKGNQTINLATSLETLPVLVRAGSFIPMVDNIQSTQDYDASKLTLHYYADKSVPTANYEMYEDDGKTYQAIEKGLFELLQFSAKQQKQLSISLNRTGKGYKSMPTARVMTLVIHNVEQAPKKVSLNNKVIKNAIWQNTDNTLTVNFTWQHQPLTLTIQ
ncbi:TIM-barrel domain-containing protein [Colwellia sp. 12G3]|uniref:TIM-barrel domain-containing protein n=1 Tax=Colwellia sp. 12G3 TaxID=2058299 RepID=UPI000C337B0C|nr:TIM-barrel domain-containing protein [Colwellia sp. 12G3]PKI14094.1 glycosyl hydrolase [Colwellia sp. 12G3]